MDIIDVLKLVSFGNQVAEEEGDSLASYFVETDNWRKILSDDVDIVYGPKGSGKSALYFLLNSRVDELFDDNILLAPAENPRGTPVFQSLVTDPPASEMEFVALWKLYLSCLASARFQDLGISTPSASKLQSALESSGLRPRHGNLKSLLNAALDYVKRVLRPKALEGGIAIDPASQMPSGVSAKIVFEEPSPDQISYGVVSIDELLQLADEALRDSNYRLWILLDRLDVAFSDSSDLEQNALRALFKVYLDLLGYKHMRLKIFLRTDIWRKITRIGFREASHITRHLTIEWDKAALLNLVVKRAVQNDNITSYLNKTQDTIMATAKDQEEFFYELFPNQVDVGQRKPSTFDWMLARTRDASKQTAPRELIHLLNALRDVQVRRLENGDDAPEGGRLFARSVFKDALKIVSRVRLEQTLYAEYPELRNRIDALHAQKTEHSLDSLQSIWQCNSESAVDAARKLVEIGFWEERGERNAPVFWVPFLYRDALGMVQGAASADYLDE